MNQSDNRPDSEFLQLSEVPVRARPIVAGSVILRRALPKRRVAQGLQAKARDVLQITVAAPVAVKLQLVVKCLPDAVDRALDAAPEFQWLVNHSLFFLRRGPASCRESKPAQRPGPCCSIDKWRAGRRSECWEGISPGCDTGRKPPRFPVAGSDSKGRPPP